MAVNFSFIIPHYNTPDLLVRCLKSIPVREDIQVIVVDDCSPNADTYQSRYPEFSRPYLEWYSTPKGGCAGRARNVGLDHAKGKWILFIDSDDYYTEGLESFLKEYVASDYDVILFKEDSYDEITHEQSDRHLNRNASIDAYFAGSVDAHSAAVWHPIVVAQMISRKHIEDNKIRFDEISIAEDTMFGAKVACLTDKICFSNEVLYVITTRSQGLHISMIGNIRKYVDYQLVMLQFVRYVRQYGVQYMRPCMIKAVYQGYKQFGTQGAREIIQMLLREHALFYGLGDYISRKFNVFIRGLHKHGE